MVLQRRTAARSPSHRLALKNSKSAFCLAAVTRAPSLAAAHATTVSWGFAFNIAPFLSTAAVVAGRVDFALQTVASTLSLAAGRAALLKQWAAPCPAVSRASKSKVRTPGRVELSPASAPSWGCVARWPTLSSGGRGTMRERILGAVLHRRFAGPRAGLTNAEATWLLHVAAPEPARVRRFD